MKKNTKICSSPTPEFPLGPGGSPALSCHHCHRCISQTGTQSPHLPPASDRDALPSLGPLVSPRNSLSPLLKYFTFLDCPRFSQHIAFLTRTPLQGARDPDSWRQRAPARPAGVLLLELGPRPRRRSARFRLPGTADSALGTADSALRPAVPSGLWLRYASPPTCPGCSRSSPASPRGCGRRAARASRLPRSPGLTRSRRRRWRARREKRGCSWCSSTRLRVRRGARGPGVGGQES